MEIVKDPRCPQHPHMEACASMRAPWCVLTWVCSACRRPLGLASFDLGFWGPRTALRRPSARRLADNVADHRWLYAQSDARHR